MPTPQPLAPLEPILRDLLNEHRGLLTHLEQQQAGLRRLDVKAVDAATAGQEACRRRIAALDARRRQLVRDLTRAAGDVPLSQLLAGFDGAPALAPLAADLRDVVRLAAARAKIVGRLASSLLGHLNTAARLLNGDGRYGKTGATAPIYKQARLRAVA